MGRYKLRQVDRTLGEEENTPDGDADGWRSRVKAIVDANIMKRVNGQVVSLRTREHNRSVIKCAFETWHNKLNHKVKVPQKLTDRHIQVLVQYWFEQGKAASTMKGDLSALRKFFGWMGKKGVVRTPEEYLPGAPAERVKIFNLKKKGNQSKSWSKGGIDVEAKLQEAFAIDERFGIIVAMQLAFGYRRKETMCIRPWVNDLREIGENSFFMHERDGTKGGKRRHIKIQFAFQVWILDYAKARTAKRATLGWPRTRAGEIATLKQNIERYKYCMKKLGITRAEVNATGHGSRAEYAENCALLEGFVPATLGFVALARSSKIRRPQHMTSMMAKTKTPSKMLPAGIGKVLKRLHYPLDVILLCVRWYVAYSLSLRNLEEMMAERDIEVDHSTVHRWAIKLLPVLEKAFRRCKRPVGKSWRMDETYVKVRGTWKYLYRAVDKGGNTVDFLLRAKRDKEAARRYFEKAIDQNGAPETVTIDKSGANLAGLRAVNAECETPIKIRQAKYLNNIVEQDHRAIKRRTRPILGFKEFHCTRILLSGIELMHMIAKGQMEDAGKLKPSAARQFYSLAM